MGRTPGPQPTPGRLFVSDPNYLEANAKGVSMKRLIRPLTTVVFLVTLAVIGSIMNRDNRASAQMSGPTVTIGAPLPLPVTGSVAISGNAPANPLEVRDVDNRDRQAYEQNSGVLIPVGVRSGQVHFTDIPAGKRLVLDQISASLDLPVGVTAFMTVFC